MESIIRRPLAPMMSAATAACGLVWTSGLIAKDVSGDIAAQMKDILGQLGPILDSVGSCKDRILIVNIWLADVADYADMNRVWLSWVSPDSLPARATVAARLALPGALVELSAIAAQL